MCMLVVGDLNSLLRNRDTGGGLALWEDDGSMLEEGCHRRFEVV